MPSNDIGIDTPTRTVRETLDLAPNAGLDSSHMVEVMARCTVEIRNPDEFIWGMQSGECRAAAYPTIRFDQAVFDRRHGDRSFPLAEHYSLRFSPNLGEMANECESSTNEPCPGESPSRAQAPR